MIHITEGSYDSINLEIISKAINSLSERKRNNIIFYTSQEISLPVKIVKTSKENNVITAIETAIKNISSKDILLTLPANKTDFKNFSGHTEYFRSKYENPNIAMMFKGLNMNALLLTDHIKLKDITNKITIQTIIEKLKIALSGHNQFFKLIDEVIFSGINPHAGEFGLLGDEEKLINTAIEKLKIQFPRIKFDGPISADTIHFTPIKPNKLFVFSYHDQGLGIFKTVNKLYGMNITLGLPFLRISPDHGTAPGMKGKNQGNYLGLYWLLDYFLD